MRHLLAMLLVTSLSFFSITHLYASESNDIQVKNNEAIQLMKEKAVKGDAEAQYILGAMYYFGIGFPSNEEKAYDYLQLASKQGHATASYCLGAFYASGYFVKSALKYYMLAVKQGNADAQYARGIMFDEGLIRTLIGTGHSKALTCYEAAAKQGSVTALYNYATMLKYGQGIPQNYKTALKFYELAAKKGHLEAQYNCASMYQNGQGTSRNSMKASFYYGLANRQKMTAVRLEPNVMRENKNIYYQLAFHQALADIHNGFGDMYGFSNSVDYIRAYAHSLIASTLDGSKQMVKESLEPRLTLSQMQKGQELAQRMWDERYCYGGI